MNVRLAALVFVWLAARTCRQEECERDGKLFEITTHLQARDDSADATLTMCALSVDPPLCATGAWPRPGKTVQMKLTPERHPLRGQVASVSAIGVIGFNFVAGPTIMWTWKDSDHVEDDDVYTVRVTRGDEELLLDRGLLGLYGTDTGCNSCEPDVAGYVRFDHEVLDAGVSLDAALPDAAPADAADAADAS